jgi:hypothetical protein
MSSRKVYSVKIEKQDEWRWRIPRHGKMRVEGMVHADEKMISAIRSGQSLQQVVNVATLPGIIGKSMAMPDVHWGIDFPSGVWRPSTSGWASYHRAVRAVWDTTSTEGLEVVHRCGSWKARVIFDL